MEDTPSTIDRGYADVPPCNIYSSDRMRHREPLKDRHRMCDAITRVEHDSGCTTRRVESKHGLDGGKEGRDVERLKEDLGGDVSVLTRVEWGFSQEYGMLQVVVKR
jgi:hypothetical protein